MHKNNNSDTKLTRRDFFKAGAAGVCALGLSTIIGCTPRRDAPAETPTTGAQTGFLRPISSPWFTKLEQSRVQCELCPKRCILAEGQRSPCRVRQNQNGEGYSLVYGNPALVQEDPVERKPFFHVVPGSRALSISTAGCNLACKFCEAWDMALVNPEEIHAYDMSPETLVAHAQASEVRALSYSFGEPVIFYEYMISTAALAKQAGFLNLLHTAGYIMPEPMRRLTEYIDAANIDLKGFDNAFYQNVVGGELKYVLETLQLVKKANLHLEITNIIIPSLNDDMTKIKQMCKWIISELGAEVPLHFSRFYPLFKLSALTRTPVSTLDAARETALAAGLKYVYIANVTGHIAESTFCPECGQTIIKRMGFIIEETHMENGLCSYCGKAIPGLWQ